MSLEEVEITNDNYRTTLDMALEWFEAWPPEVLVVCGMDLAEARDVVDAVRRRHTELSGASRGG
jgi:hypothetical protein